MADPKPITEQEFERVLHLTETEYEVFKLVGDGLTYREIGRKRHVTHSTISTYADRIREKLFLHNVKKVMTLAVRYNLSGLKRVPVLPTYRFATRNEFKNVSPEPYKTSENIDKLLNRNISFSES